MNGKGLTMTSIDVSRLACCRMGASKAYIERAYRGRLVVVSDCAALAFGEGSACDAR